MFQTQLPIYHGENYAPTKPLLDLRENPRPHPSDLNSQIKALYDELNKKDEDVIFSIAETAYVISGHIQGKNVWQRDYYSGGLTIVPTQRKNPFKTTSINTMQFQISQMLEDLISSNPDHEPSDMFKSFEYLQAAKKAKAVINHYEPRLWTPYFNIMQALDLLTSGTAIEQLKYDAGAKSFRMFKDIWGEAESVIDEGGGECYSCGTTASYEDFHRHKQGEKEEQRDGDTDQPMGFPQCPECESFQVEAVEPQTAKFPVLTGREQYDIGDFVLLLRSILSTRFDVSKRPEDSPYFITKDYIPNSRVKRLLGDIQLSGGTTGTDLGLEYLHKMSRIGAGIGGAKREYGSPSSSAAHKTSMLISMSIDVDLCAEIEIPNTYSERETLSGELPKSGTLADVPGVAENGGATIIGFNGLSMIYGIYPRHHSKEIASIQYFSKPNSGIGRGAEDLAEMQVRRNRLDAQQVAAVDGASPGYVAVEGSMDEADLKRIGHPNSRGFISAAAFNMAGQDINRAIKQFPPQQVAPQLFAYSQDIEKFTQMAAHNVGMSGAVFDADVKTATGQNILRETAREISIPFLTSKAGARSRTIKNLLHGYKECFPGVKRTFSLGASSNRQFSQIEVDGQDINPEIEFVIVANSEIPQNYYLRKVDYLGLTQALGGVEIIQQLSAVNPQLLNVYEKAFNIDLGLNGFDRIEEICHLRMEEAFEWLEIFGELILEAGNEQQAMTVGQQDMEPGVTDPFEQGQPAEEEVLPSGFENMMPQGRSENGLTPENENYAFDMLLENIKPKILPKEKNHKAKSDWFCDFLDSEDGLKLSEIERRVLVELALKHEEMETIATSGMMANQALTESAVGMPIAAIEAKAGMIAQAAMPEEEPATKSKSKPKPKAKAA